MSKSQKVECMHKQKQKTVVYLNSIMQHTNVIVARGYITDKTSYRIIAEMLYASLIRNEKKDQSLSSDSKICHSFRSICTEYWKWSGRISISLLCVKMNIQISDHNWKENHMTSNRILVFGEHQFMNKKWIDSSTIHILILMQMNFVECCRIEVFKFESSNQIWNHFEIFHESHSVLFIYNIHLNGISTVQIHLWPFELLAWNILMFGKNLKFVIDIFFMAE